MKRSESDLTSVKSQIRLEACLHKCRPSGRLPRHEAEADRLLFRSTMGDGWHGIARCLFEKLVVVCQRFGVS
jgi:hypothetical protein